MDANNGGMLGAWLMCYGGQYCQSCPPTGPDILECGGLPPLLRTEQLRKSVFLWSKDRPTPPCRSSPGLRAENDTMSAHNIEKLAHAPVLFVARLDQLFRALVGQHKKLFLEHFGKELRGRFVIAVGAPIGLANDLVNDA